MAAFMKQQESVVFLLAPSAPHVVMCESEVADRFHMFNVNQLPQNAVIYDLFDLAESIHISECVTNGNDKTGFPLGSFNQLTAVKRIRQRFLNQDMTPPLKAGNRRTRVLVVHCGDNDSVTHR